jgi:phospholipase C
MRMLRGRLTLHRRAILVAATLLAVGLIGAMGVASGAANLLPNGTFEGAGSGSLSGWKGSNATLALTTDGFGGGHAARVAVTSGATTYAIIAKPKPVGSTTAGTKYVANAMFRSDTPGQTLCFRLKEFNSSNVGKGQGLQCAVATSAWQAFPEIDYTAVASGDSVDLRVLQQANAAVGQSFEVDNLSLVTGSVDTTPPTVPTGVTATANGPTEIDVTWSPSSDAGGVAGYSIYRGGTAVGTSTTTSFADTGLTAGTTYSYTVDAVDTSNNRSAQSDPPVSATTDHDTTVPTAPATLTATTVSASRVDLAWSASSDPEGVNGYRIFRDGSKIAEVTSGLSYSDTSVVPSTTYSYTVRAFDSANESPDSPTATATTPAAGGDPIKHVVVIYQENNSFDEVLGYTCAVTLGGRCDGATTGKVSTGATIPLAQPPDIVPTVNHSPGSMTTAIDGGKMDAFDKISGCSAPSYACYVSYRPGQIPNLSMYAQQYVVADRTFESQLSASWGSHVDLVSSTLDGFKGVNPSHAAFSTKGWGCDSGATAPWKDPKTGAASNQPTCIPDFGLDPTQFPHGGAFEATSVPHVPTIMDAMNTAGVTWHIYAPTSTQQFYGWSICPSFADCLYTNEKQSTSQPSQVLTDAANGTLPSVSYVIPLDNQSQHNSNSMLAGDNWIGSVVNAVMNGPDWSSTAIFITYDDCGCFYDHVPPPAGAGVREPMVIVSPCAKSAYTDHNTAYAGESTMAFIEHTFNLPSLVAGGDGSAYDFSQSFDFSQPGCGGAGAAAATAPRATMHPISAAEKAYIKAHPADPNDPS